VTEIGDIVRAVEAGDADAAANACSTHVRNAATTGLARMEETEGVTAVR
jgi:DNA-binding GntR family transcriptional regulator